MEETGAKDQNPVVSTDYIGRGLQILRNISRTKELAENELTPLTLPTTPPGKVLDIFLLFL